MLCFANQRSGTCPAVSVVCDFEQAVELFALIFFFFSHFKNKGMDCVFYYLKKNHGVKYVRVKKEMARQCF